MRLILLLLAALTLAAPPAWACFFEIPSTKDAQKFMKEHYGEYDYIIKARVKEVYLINNIQDPVTRIEVLATYKGEMPQEIKVYDEFGHTSCGYNFKEDEERIVILKKKEDKFYPVFIASSLTASVAGEKFLESLGGIVEFSK